MLWSIVVVFSLNLLKSRHLTYCRHQSRLLLLKLLLRVNKLWKIYRIQKINVRVVIQNASLLLPLSLNLKFSRRAIFLFNSGIQLRRCSLIIHTSGLQIWIEHCLQIWWIWIKNATSLMGPYFRQNTWRFLVDRSRLLWCFSMMKVGARSTHCIARIGQHHWSIRRANWWQIFVCSWHPLRAWPMVQCFKLSFHSVLVSVTVMRRRL